MSEAVTKAVRKKTGKTSKRKTGTSAAKKKQSAASSLRLSAKEKKLIADYRKCNAIAKSLISSLTEKAAGGLSSITDLLGK